MEQVILYVRVSTDEQANKGFSLRDQEQKLLNYCKLHDLEVVYIFREDYSAKSFNRPEFKNLLNYCKTNKHLVDKLLFLKWDRFSRNTAESYQMLKQFNNFEITINAIEQPLDLTIPEQGLMLAVYLSMPEVENHRRSLNVIAGMRRAYKEGRYVASPPKGYTMSRDVNNKPLIQPNEDAQYITEAFNLMATGLHNQKKVLYKLRLKGFKISKTAFSRVLRNQLYHGDIYIKAFNNEKAQMVKSNGCSMALIVISKLLNCLSI